MRVLYPGPSSTVSGSVAQGFQKQQKIEGGAVLAQTENPQTPVINQVHVSTSVKVNSGRPAAGKRRVRRNSESSD